MLDHWFKEIKENINWSDCKYLQCVQCCNIKCIIKTTNGIDESIEYSTRGGNLHYIPNGNLRICREHLNDKVRRHERYAVNYKDAKHEFKTVDYFHKQCKICGLVHLEFSIPGHGGAAVNEYYEIIDGLFSFVGEQGHNLGDLETISCKDQIGRKIEMRR